MPQPPLRGSVLRRGKKHGICLAHRGGTVLLVPVLVPWQSRAHDVALGVLEAGLAGIALSRMSGLVVRCSDAQLLALAEQEIVGQLADALTRLVADSASRAHRDRVACGTWCGEREGRAGRMEGERPVNLVGERLGRFALSNGRL